MYSGRLNDPIYDRTDTVSIASIESSIFDLDSSFNSTRLENHFEKRPSAKKATHHYPFKTKSFKLHDKIPENWLYVPKHVKKEDSNRNIKETEKWIRDVFQTDKLTGKSLLKQQLSKSQNDLSYIEPNHDHMPTSPRMPGNEPNSPREFHSSTSDLKNILLKPANNHNDQVERNMKPISKTAPGSTENIADHPGRSSFKEILALAKQQEDKLKAEVMRRRRDIELQNRPSTTVKLLKNSKKPIAAPSANRFGYSRDTKTGHPVAIATVTTKFSAKPTIDPRYSLVSAKSSGTSSTKIGAPRISSAINTRRSADFNNRKIREYHV